MIEPYRRAIRLEGGRRLAARDLAVVRHDVGRDDDAALTHGVAHAERLGRSLAHLAGGRLSIREAGVVALGMARTCDERVGEGVELARVLYLSI